MPANPAAQQDVYDPRPLLAALRLMRKGDFSARLPLDMTGMSGEVAAAFNDIVDLNGGLCGELQRVCNVVGKEGQIGQRASLPGGVGAWATCIDAVNTLITDLVQPTTEVARVIGCVARGDLSQKMETEIDGRP